MYSDYVILRTSVPCPSKKSRLKVHDTYSVWLIWLVSNTITPLQHKNIDSDSDEDSQSSAMSSSEAEDFMTEVDHYLSMVQVKDVDDPLSWWYENWGTYPCLWCMARDYLTIPGMLVKSLTVIQQAVTDHKLIT